VEVSWTVRNQGDGLASFHWNDAIYYSTNSTFGRDALLLSQPWHATELVAGSSYTATAKITVPDHAQGVFYLIVQTDSQRAIYETDETNNHRIVVWAMFEESPQLSVSRRGRSVEIAWPASMVEYHLESTAQLGPSAWEIVTNEVSVMGTRQVCTVGCSPECRYYRLRKD